MSSLINLLSCFVTISIVISSLSLDVLIPIKEKHAALVSSYIEQRKIKDMHIEVIPIKGKPSVNQVFSSISDKIDVIIFIRYREIF